MLLIDFKAMKDACQILAVLMGLGLFVLTKVSGCTGAATADYRCSVFFNADGASDKVFII